ncbi:hypothetical protein DFP72DRAFT_856561 [Ephemerocybe angulata]|nr:hypothetical protein DFP72DRAFT_856561 [Tulosesus angulatus]
MSRPLTFVNSRTILSPFVIPAARGIHFCCYIAVHVLNLAQSDSTHTARLEFSFRYLEHDDGLEHSPARPCQVSGDPRLPRYVTLLSPFILIIDFVIPAFGLYGCLDTGIARCRSRHMALQGYPKYKGWLGHRHRTLSISGRRTRRDGLEPEFRIPGTRHREYIRKMKHCKLGSVRRLFGWLGARPDRRRRHPPSRPIAGTPSLRSCTPASQISRRLFAKPPND